MPTIVRPASERDCIFDICRGQLAVDIRAVVAEFAARYGYVKTLPQVRLQIQMLIDEGRLVRVGRPRSGMVGDPRAISEFNPS